MFFYLLFLLFTVIMLTSSLDVTANKFYLNKKILLFYCLCAAILAGMREGVDRDYYSYIDIYNSIPTLSEWLSDYGQDQLAGLSKEIGYIFINALSKELFASYQPVFLIMALLSLTFYYIAISRNSNHIFLSFLVYFSVFYTSKELTQIRHGLACAIFLYSLQFFHQRNFKKFALTNLFGGLFHLAVLPSILVYPLGKIKWSLYKVLLVLVGCFFIQEVDWLNSILGNFLDFSLISNRVLAYHENADFVFEISTQKNPLLTRYTFLLLGAIIFKEKLSTKIKQYNELIAMLVLGIIYINSFHELQIIGDRFSISLFTSIIIILPGFMYLSEKICFKYLILISIWIISALMFISSLKILDFEFNLF